MTDPLSSRKNFSKCVHRTNFKSQRLESVDLLRAITMLLMIFVNDVAGVSDLPGWLRHADANDDALGFADVIFPAFLFIVGLSLPLAIESRIAKGKSLLATSLYILGRSIALITMGFFHVNSENYSQNAVLPHSIWMILTTLGFFLIWLKYPDRMNKGAAIMLKTAGILLLISMIWLFQGSSAEKPEGMHTSWWGILGIIGWAYFVCAILVLLVRMNKDLTIIIATIFGAINILSHLNRIPFDIPIIGDASSVFLVMAGAACSLIYCNLFSANKLKAAFAFIAIGLFLIMLGNYIRPFTGGISKIYSTPAWTFICAGITLLAFSASIFIVDVHQKASVFKWIKPAGTSTLTCYLIPYILYSLFELAGVWYPSIFNAGIAGILRSFTVAFLVIAFVGFAERKNLRLKL